jgi:hypothetical protein
MRDAKNERMTHEQWCAVIDVLQEVRAERERQHAKWGEQDHPNGTGSALPGGERAARRTADEIRAGCDKAFRDGKGTWAHILCEEVAEACCETDRVKLRAELVQVAAVAVQWVEKLDRDSARSGK